MTTVTAILLMIGIANLIRKWWKSSEFTAEDDWGFLDYWFRGGTRK